MKKNTKHLITCLLVVTTLFVSGCGKTGQDMNFEQAYATLKSHNIFANKTYSTPDTSKVLSDKTIVDFNLQSTEGFTASGSITSNGTYNLPSITGGSDMHLTVQAIAFEPSFGGNIELSGDIQFVDTNNRIFGIIHQFGVTPEKESGNVEGGVINALVGTISKKWIELTATGATGSLVPYRKNFLEFIHQFNIGRNQYDLFKEAGKTTIDGYTAYKLARDENGVKGFVEHILQDARNIGTPISFDGTTMDEAIQGIVSSPLDGYLIIKSSDHIVLQINSVKTQDSGIIGFTYDKNGLDIKIRDTTNTIVAICTITKEKKELAFSLTIPANNIKITGFTKNNQQQIEATINAATFVLSLTIDGETNAIDSFTPVTIDSSIPLSQILEGLAIIGQGMNESQ